MPARKRRKKTDTEHSPHGEFDSADERFNDEARSAEDAAEELTLAELDARTEANLDRDFGGRIAGFGKKHRSMRTVDAATEVFVADSEHRGLFGSFAEAAGVPFASAFRDFEYAGVIVPLEGFEDACYAARLHEAERRRGRQLLARSSAQLDAVKDALKDRREQLVPSHEVLRRVWEDEWEVFSEVNRVEFACSGNALLALQLVLLRCDLYTISAFSQSCKPFRALVYGEDSNLWEQLLAFYFGPTVVCEDCEGSVDDRTMFDRLAHGIPVGGELCGGCAEVRDVIMAGATTEQWNEQFLARPLLLRKYRKEVAQELPDWEAEARYGSDSAFTMEQLSADYPQQWVARAQRAVIPGTKKRGPRQPNSPTPEHAAWRIIFWHACDIFTLLAGVSRTCRQFHELINEKRFVFDLLVRDFSYQFACRHHVSGCDNIVKDSSEAGDDSGVRFLWQRYQLRAAHLAAYPSCTGCSLVATAVDSNSLGLFHAIYTVHARNILAVVSTRKDRALALESAIRFTLVKVKLTFQEDDPAFWKNLPEVRGYPHGKSHVTPAHAAALAVGLYWLRKRFSGPDTKDFQSGLINKLDRHFVSQFPPRPFWAALLEFMDDNLETLRRRLKHHRDLIRMQKEAKKVYRW